ncbi:MAG: hypothetical protein KAH18_13175 [Psychromonas sp.]|nr:hypothetical protein [Psychromonas sp.]
MRKSNILNKTWMKYIFIFSAFSGINNIAFADPGDMEISNMAGPSPITIKTCSYDAGAICSLTWNGKEFINDYDHGRQLQSAASFDGLGEKYNPTEAGASEATDGINPHPSSSVLIDFWSYKNVFSTETKMAFWKPVDGQATSNYRWVKYVQIGLQGLPHVISYQTWATIPDSEHPRSGIFEAVMGYMPSEFSNFWTYDIKHNKLTPLKKGGPDEQNLPVILSTPDGGWAMGIYSSNSPQKSWPTVGYGTFRFIPQKVVKWNNVFRVNNPHGVIRFISYVIVGSLQDVRDSMHKLSGYISAHASRDRGNALIVK